MGTASGSVATDENFVIFTLNGKIHKVHDLPPRTSLLTYIRDQAGLTGTKFMCREGGCGACIVTITTTHPDTHDDRSLSVNSCLYPLFSCHGKSVTTVEGIGNKQRGYHPVQQRLANFYGTQCGYCSPGWVMAMYSLLKSSPHLTMEEIEGSLGSNVCRCTGYRPILDAFKTFASDCSESLYEKLTDIEDLTGRCLSRGRACVGPPEEHDLACQFVEVALSVPSLHLQLQGSAWYRVASVKEIFEIFDMISGTYMLVGGNTAQGVFEFKYPKPADVYIDVGGVRELQSHRLSGGLLWLGGSITLTDTAALFRRLSRDKPDTFSYLEVLAKHIDKIAHIPVRNVATIAGNLSTKYKKKSFESDIFTTFEAAGAKLNIVSAASMSQVVSLPEYLEIDMYKKVITHVLLPPLDRRYYMLKTYKISKIVQNSHAYVNAGFLFKLDKAYQVLERPRIVFGGISPNFIHAERTETFLKGKLLLDNSVCQGALSLLDKEVRPDRELPQASEAYRKGLALALFYKFVLSVAPRLVSPQYRSGGEDLARPLSSGKQEFSTDPSLYPVNKPMPKLEALIQCSGEAEYNYDTPVAEGDLFAALVVSDRGPATLASIDPTPALKIPGVVAFFSSKDIPGKNTLGAPASFFIVEDEKLMAESEVQYAGQVVGVVVARSQDVADFAASRVVVKYTAQTQPKLTVPEVLESGEQDDVILQGTIEPTSVKTDTTHEIQGVFQTRGQYHYHLETQTCVVFPSADGLEVRVSSHWPQLVQEGLSLVLNIPANSINVRVTRVGGSFGGKITRANIASCVCGLAAFLLRTTVRIILPMETNMKAIGPRKPTYYKYKVGVNDDGVIQKLEASYYDNVGAARNEDQFMIGSANLVGVYDPSTWRVAFYDTRSDRTATCWMRAPGHLTTYISTENLMEHIAKVVKKDPLQVRLNNLAPQTQAVRDMILELKEKADYDTRMDICHKFNKENVWKKRGLALSAMSYEVVFGGSTYSLVSIYRLDGTVAIQHGGVELGQGVNTQAAQTCARVLGVPLHFVQVKEVFNLTSPNAVATGGSVTGDSITFAVTKCCEILNERLAPARQKLVNPSWQQLIQQAYSDNVNLNTTYMFNLNTDAKKYNVSGVAASEVKVDCLTGEHTVLRVDVLEDAGQSVNPYIDIGQAEGAFVMGMGFLTSEELIYDKNTGKLLTNRSWEYKVPQAKDIPIDFRVYLKKNSVNTTGPTRSKTISEPPILLSFTVLSALRRALESVRTDLGYEDDFFVFEPPATPEKIFLTVGSSYKNYLI